MSQTDYAIEATTRHHVLLNGYATGTVKENLGQILVLNRELQSLVTSVGPGEIISAQVISEKLREMETLIVDSLDQMGESVMESARQLSTVEAQFAQELLKTSATTAAAIDVALPAEEILLGAVNRPMELISGKMKRKVSMQAAFKEFSGNKAGEITRTIAQGFVAGTPRDEIAKTVGRMVKGRTAAQAEALTRTTIFHASNEARDATYQANANLIDYELWDSVLDSRTTLTCAHFDGEKFQPGEGERPPIHWNCRSARIPVLKQQYQALGLDGMRPAVGKNGPGQTRARSYGSWLRSQGAAFQDKALGPQRGKLFRQGGLDIKDFSSASGHPLTLAELAQAHPLAFEKANIPIN